MYQVGVFAFQDTKKPLFIIESYVTIRPMTLQDRIKSLRNEIGLSQEAMGSQGFISVPGWVKIENGQRTPSDKLIMRLISWLLNEERLSVSRAARIMEELLTLKYLRSHSSFVRDLARVRAEELFEDLPVRLAEDPETYRAKSRRKRTGRKSK